MCKAGWCHECGLRLATILDGEVLDKQRSYLCRTVEGNFGLGRGNRDEEHV